jgi:clan AA aspartic protease
MGFIHIAVQVKAVGHHVEVYEAPFLVDTGAIDSMAPAAELRRIGIEPIGHDRYEMADGTVHEYPYGIAQLEVMGRAVGTRIVFGPDDIEPLLGVTALESAGLSIEPATQTLRRSRTLRL